jgi:hypothetical protein
VVVHTPYHAEALQALGVQWVRVDIRWASIEPGQAGAYSWDETDKLLNYYLERGFRVMGVLDMGELPPAYRQQTSERWVGALATWAGQLAHRFVGRGVLWELGNEPEGSSPEGAWRQPEAYARTARTIAASIRVSDPNAHIAALSVAWMDRNYIARALAAGLLQDGSIDTLSYHGYHRRELVPESGLDEDVSWLREQIARAAPGRVVHLVDSERGYALHPGELKPWAVWRNWVGTESEQAAFLARHYLTSIAARVETVVWYKDLWGEEGFSLYYADEHDPRGLRPMGKVYRALAHLLPDPPALIHNDRFAATLLDDLKNVSDPNTLLEMRTFLLHRPGMDRLVVAIWNPVESTDGKVLVSRQREGDNYLETWRPARPEDQSVLDVRLEIDGASPNQLKAMSRYDLLAAPDKAFSPLQPEWQGARLLAPRVSVGPLPTVLVIDLAP